jgi:DNA-binding PadR family transcriptional regulator
MIRAIRVTPNVQAHCIEELSTGNKTGKHLRMRLEARGHDLSRKAFYHNIRQLKDAGLIRARRIPRDPGEYRGAQAVYELTEPGWDEVHAWRAYLEEGEQKARECREWNRRCRLALEQGRSPGVVI